MENSCIGHCTSCFDVVSLTLVYLSYIIIGFSGIKGFLQVVLKLGSFDPSCSRFSRFSLAYHFGTLIRTTHPVMNLFPDLISYRLKQDFQFIRRVLIIMGRSSEVSTTRAPSSSVAPPGRGRKRLQDDEHHERSPGPGKVRAHKGGQPDKGKKRKEDQSEEKRMAVPAKRMRSKTSAVQFLARLYIPFKSHPSVQQLPL